MAPVRLGGDLRMMSPTGPAETREGNGAPLKTEASVGNPGLWAEYRGTVGRPLMAGGPLLEDGVAGLPHKQETSGRIFWECTVAVEGHCNKFCQEVVKPYK